MTRAVLWVAVSSAEQAADDKYSLVAQEESSLQRSA